MKKALSLAAVACVAVALTLMPKQQQDSVPQIDQAAVNAQIDARLHVLLGRLIAQGRAAEGQLAVR